MKTLAEIISVLIVLSLFLCGINALANRLVEDSYSQEDYAHGLSSEVGR